MAVLRSGAGVSLSNGGIIRQAGPAPCPLPMPLRGRIACPSWAAIFNNANTTVGDQVAGVHRITKTGGVASTWDSDAISAMSFAGDFVLMAQPLQLSADLIVGVNADPITDSDWASIDRGMLFSSDGNIYFVGSGFISGALAAYQTDRFYFIRRSGTVVDLLWNTTDDVTTATSLSDFAGLHTYTAVTYFDSSFYTSGGAVDVRLDVPPPSAIALSLAADVGAFTYTGQAAALEQGYDLTAANATFTYSGQAASLLLGRALAAANASFTYSGQASGLLRGYDLASASATFAYSGQAAGLVAAYGLPMAAASFSYSGQDALLARGYAMPAGLGSFSYSGQAAQLQPSLGLIADAGMFAYTGEDAAFAAHLTMPGGHGAFSYAGQAAMATLSLASFPPAGSAAGVRVTTAFLRP